MLFYFILVENGGKEGGEGLGTLRTAVHHAVCMEKRKRTRELLCEGTDVALREVSFDDKVEEALGYFGILSRAATLCPGLRGHPQGDPSEDPRSSLIMSRTSWRRPYARFSVQSSILFTNTWLSSKYAFTFTNDQVFPSLLTIQSIGHRKRSLRA